MEKGIAVLLNELIDYHGFSQSVRSNGISSSFFFPFVSSIDSLHPSKCDHFFLFFLFLLHLTPAKLLPFAPPNHINFYLIFFFFWFLFIFSLLLSLLVCAVNFFLLLHENKAFLICWSRHPSFCGCRGFFFQPSRNSSEFLLELLRRRLRRKGVPRKPPSFFLTAAETPANPYPDGTFFPDRTSLFSHVMISSHLKFHS